MATGDIIVQRVTGANVQVANLTGVLNIAVIGRSYGAATADSATGIRGTGNTDLLSAFTVKEFKDNLRSIGNITDEQQAGEVYYPNIQFLVKKVAGGALVDPRNLGANSDPDALEFDWSSAPALVAPNIVQTSTILYAHTSGFTSSGTYYYAVSAIDHQGLETTVGPIQQVDVPAPGGGQSYGVILTWKLTDYSSGYKVYRGTLADGSDLALIYTSASKTTVSYTDVNHTASGSKQATNLTQQRPTSGDTLYCSYVYGAVSYNAAKQYTAYDQVLNDHGQGSELANIAKLILDPNYNNAPMMTTVVPLDGSYNAYLTALDVLAGIDCQFVAMLYQGASGTSDWVALQMSAYQHSASMSDPISGQKERYTIFALPWVPGRSVYDAKTVAQSMQNSATGGKRGILVYPDGGRAQALLWANQDGSTDTYYEGRDTAGYSLTELYFAVAAIASYSGLRDTAEPCTEKDVIGFYLPNTPGTTTEINLLRNASVFAIENRGGVSVISRGVNMGLDLSLEDGELNISVTEDWMRGDLRAAMRIYRGRKMLTPMLRAAARTLAQKLAQYVSNEKIAYYDPSSVTCTQDPTQKDRLIGFFKYMPVYPINNLDVLYDFTFVVL